MVGLGGDGTAARVRELLEVPVLDGRTAALRAVAAAAVTLALGAALSLPAAVSVLGGPVALCGGL
jgi:hypothetical protein